MPSGNDELLRAIGELNKNINNLSNYMQRANDMGYVGDQGVMPVFSDDIRRMREEIANAKNDFAELTSGFGIKDELNSIPGLYSKIAEAHRELNDAIDKGDNASRDAASARIKQLIDQIDSIRDKVDAFQNKHDIDLSDWDYKAKLEEKINAKMVEILVMRNEENKKLKEINKEIEYRNKLEEGTLTVQDKINHTLEEHHFNVTKFNNGLSQVKSGFSGMLGAARGLIEPWGKLNQAAAEYARSIGMSHNRFRELQKTVNGTARDRRIGAKYAISDVEALQTQQNYTLNIGRQTGFNADQLEDTSALQRMVGGESAVNYMSQLEKFGLSQTEVAGRVNEMFKDSEKSGIAFNKYSKAFLDNIKLAQTYTFRNGINGLQEMAKRATEIRMSLSDVASFADKISTLEGATQAAAGLSVLGGNFALGANPLTMLYNGLMNMEGVQGQMEDMLKGLVYYDKEKQTLDMNSYSRNILKQASQVMGVSYENMVESAFAIGRESYVSDALRGRGIKKDSREYEALKNKSFIKGGKAYVNINGEEQEVSKLSDEQIRYVTKTDFKEEDGIRKIAETLLGFDDNIKAIKDAKDNELTYWTEVTHIGDAAEEILQLMKGIAPFLAGMQAIGTGILMAIHGGNMFMGMRSMAGAYGTGSGVPAIAPLGGGTGAAGSGSATLATATASQRMRTAGMLYNNARSAGFSKAGSRWLVRDEMMKNGVTARQANRALFASRAMSVGSKIGGAGMMGMLGYAIGSGIGDYANYKMTKGTDVGLYSNDEKVRNEAIDKKGWGGAAKGAMSWGLSGAMTGAMLGGPLGALVGGSVGALVGALTGKISAREEAEKTALLNLIKSRYGIDLNGDYTNDELKKILDGDRAIAKDKALISKINAFENITDLGKFRPIRKMRSGGVIRGVGSGTSDSNLAWVSNNEYIMPADKTLKPNNRKILDSMRSGDDLIPSYKDGGVNITPTGNRLNIMKVNDYGRNVGVDVPRIGTTKVELAPLTINGSIRLEMNGQSRNVSASDIFDNPYNLRQLTDIIAKNLNRQYNFGFDKNEFYKKY